MAKKTARRKASKGSKANARKAIKAGTRRDTPQFSDDAVIHILEAGRENPRRKGSDPYKRYEVLLKSRRVSDFLKSQPKWRSTIYRALRENRIRIG